MRKGREIPAFYALFDQMIAKFFKKYSKLHSWLLANLALIGLFLLTRNNRAWMNALTTYVTEPLKRTVADFTYLVEFSVAEVLYISAIAAAIIWLADTVRCLAQRRWQVIYPRLLGAVCIGLSIYVGLTLLWGVNYYTDSFQDQSGIYAREATVEELTELTQIFAQGVLDTWDQVERDENGLFAQPREDIFAASTGIYRHIYDEFPFLELEDRVPKALALSEPFSMMDFTGFFFPFTGEANLNVHSPAMYLPVTIVHEMAHLRGIASEQECNFLGIVASTASDNPVYQYSGWLFGYVYTGNALYRADPEAWAAIRATIPEEVAADLRCHSAYWSSYEGPVSEAASNAYDSFLKNYGDEDGVQSYGMVVDLLIAYYLD